MGWNISRITAYGTKIKPRIPGNWDLDYQNKFEHSSESPYWHSFFEDLEV